MATTLADLGFLIGTWACTYAAGGQHVPYTAVFSYDVQQNWILERDAWPGGGGDVAYLTYVPKDKSWTYAALESDRTTTIFRGTGPASRVVYRMVYPPGTSATEVFQRVSSTKYTTNFTGTLEGKSVTAADTCTKH